MTGDCHEDQLIARYTIEEHFTYIIDSALPDKSTSTKRVPEYMIDFYKESNLSDKLIKTADNLKLSILDSEISEYLTVIKKLSN